MQKWNCIQMHLLEAMQPFSQRDDKDHSLHPVYYINGKATAVEQKYHSYELEVLAIIKTLRTFKVYLISIKFKIVTNCYNLQIMKIDIVRI